jgi:predicted SprT family Zn-dependent metalloprotease
MLCVDRLSQRGLRDAFSSPLFRTLFNYSGKKGISHSSISDRLAVLNVDFFKNVYEYMYHKFSQLYSDEAIAGMRLQRVDSTLVKESSNKLHEGLTCGNDYKKGKMLKYTINFDGMFATMGSVHKEECYASESLALPENVMNHFKKEKDHATVYLFDRGQSSGEAFSKMKNREGLQFVGRLLENRSLKVIKEFACHEVEFTYGELLEDKVVQLYKTVHEKGKNGKDVRKQVLVDEVFRVIKFKPVGKEEAIILITNIMDVLEDEQDVFVISADTIAAMYKRRWDIEVFFRFIKQELNFSHFLSLTENGIEIILYMTMITAMLVMIYKKENKIGYKTAVRRMRIELECLITAIIVIESGGDLKKTQLPDP